MSFDFSFGRLFEVRLFGFYPYVILNTICFTGRPGFDPSEAGRGGELGEGSYIISIFLQVIMGYLSDIVVFVFNHLVYFFK